MSIFLIFSISYLLNSWFKWNARHRCSSSWKIRAWYFESYPIYDLRYASFAIYDIRTTIYGLSNIQFCQVYDVLIQQQFFVLAGD